MAVATRARAYVNWGRWVCDCPRADCNSAELLEPQQATFHCSYCRALAAVDWPPDADGIWDALARRPVPSTRNWFPAGHELALRAGLPHGQTVVDLAEENHEHGLDGGQ
jgi:hypothetical protein